MPIGGEQHRAHAGGDAAADVADLVERRVGSDLGQRDAGHHDVVGEGAGAHVVQDGLAIDRETRRAVGHQALALGAADGLAQVGLARQAELAVAALGRVEGDHVVARLQPGHAGAHLQHHAGALMAQDGGEQAFGVGAAEGVVVGVADAGGLHFHQHLAVPRAGQVDGFDGERGAGLPGDGSLGLHGDVLGWMGLAGPVRPA